MFLSMATNPFRRCIPAFSLRTPGCLLICIVFITTLSSCNEPAQVSEPAFQQSASEREAVLAALRSAERSAMQNAFATLPAYEFARRVRTEQLDLQGQVAAYEEYIAHHTTDNGLPAVKIEKQDSSGVFHRGFLFWPDPSSAARLPHEVAEYILPEDPPYLSERNRDAFYYTSLPDTLLSALTVEVLDVRARPESGSKQNIRHVRLFIDKETREVIALAVEQVQNAFLFQENSHFFLKIRKLQDNEWAPDSMLAQTRIHVPLLPARNYRTSSSYYNYIPVSSDTREAVQKQ